MDSPFEILLVDQDADEEEITQAYRQRIKESHPDQGGSAEEFQLVRAAYDAIMADDGEDRVFDDDWHAHQTPRDADAEPEHPRTATVEYLDYEAVVDNDWELDADAFSQASEADLEHTAYGQFLVEDDETVLEAAEHRGFTWPYACRGGACANCAVAVVSGELSMPVNHVLPAEMLDRGFRLSCVGKPLTRDLQVVFNVKHLPGLDELRLPPYPFRNANGHDSP